MTRLLASRCLAAAAFLACLASAGLGAAHDYRLAQLEIEHPWARPSIGMAKAGAVYLTLVNLGDSVDRLIAAETPVAARAELHTHLMDQGIMRMRPVEAIEVAPGAPTVLQPGGLHVMLFGLKAPLEEGTRFPLVLTFERAGSIEVAVAVETPAGQDRPAHGHGMTPQHGS